jgi:hypothetical protein
MNSGIHPLLKILVTGVTRVTHPTTPPYSLGFSVVTRISNFTYTARNAFKMCNERSKLWLLLAIKPKARRAGLTLSVRGLGQSHG